MKKLNWFLLAVLLAVIPALQSCDDNDGYSIGDMGVDWATVRVLSGNTYYLEGDSWGTMWLGGSNVWYKPIDGQRIISSFNPLYDDFQGYDHAVMLNRVSIVLTKEVEDLTAENEAEFGNDPIVIWKNDMWIGGNYLNVIFQQNLPLKEKHRISLVRNTTIEDPNDGYIHLECRYNDYDDLSGYGLPGYVSFNLSSLDIEENTKGIKVKRTSKDGEEVVTFDLKNTSVPKSVKGMDFSGEPTDKLK